MRYTSMSMIGLVTISLGCANSEPPTEEEYPDAVTADPAHYAVEFENDVARLLRITYGPGERSVMHHHPANCSVALGTASWRMTDPAGDVTEDAPTAVGEVNCGDSDAVHLPENAGSETSELILVEFKDGSSPGTVVEESEYPDAVTADPDHYTVEFENDVVRVLRIAYEPGERSVLHHHPANCAVTLNDASWGMTDAADEVTENTNTAGLLNCGDADVHLPENTGAESSEVILIEFKNRATFER